MRKADFDYHIEGDLPGLGQARFDYVNPDPDGDGVAYNASRC